MEPGVPKAGLEKLSLTMIEVLKDLSAAKRPLTADSLCKAFEQKEDLIDWLSNQSLGDHRSMGNGGKSTTVKGEVETLKEKNRKLRDRERRLTMQVAAMDDDKARLRNFSKRAMITLITLAMDPRNEPLSAALETLRAMVQDDADIEAQFQSLQQLKELIFREEPQGGRYREELSLEALSSASGMSSFALARGEGDPLSPYIPKVQHAFLSILTHLEPVSETANQHVFSDLRVRIAQCQDMATLVSLGEDVVGFVKTYVGRIAQQNDQVAIFAKELGKNLTEMEEQLLFSLNVAHEGHRANGEFSTVLQGEVEDIKGSFHREKSIAEVREFVFSKLKTIRSALEHKSKQDEIRFHQAQTSMEDLKKNLFTMSAEINRVQEKARSLEREVLLDSLTGIHNRRAYGQRIQEEFARYRRYGMTYSLVMFDVDHFKKLNDQYGHRAGDKCLREIINRVKSCTRTTDFVARYGGEEFVIILTGTNKEGAYVVAEKVRRVIEKTRFLFQDKTIPVTISLGVSEIHSEDRDVDAVFSRADDAMYRAKKEGRNRVCAS